MNRALALERIAPQSSPAAAFPKVIDRQVPIAYALHMEVRLTPDLEAKLNQLSAQTGRAKEELVQDAMAGYLAELSQVRDTLDSRYHDIKSGRVKPIDGKEVFSRMRQKKTDHRRS